jgi:hypothetical protein
MPNPDRAGGIFRAGQPDAPAVRFDPGQSGRAGSGTIFAASVHARPGAIAQDGGGRIRD